MNIIQLSEQLKDVPDNFLLTEVQNPTGSYPSYLVVAELTRRKRMRANANPEFQEPPTTTVAEDLIAPQQPEQPAGLGALAQPGEMAAQDVGIEPPDPMGLGMAQEMAMGAPMGMPMGMPMEQPPMMAGGGLVAFRDGGDVIRAQSGMFVNPGEEVQPTFEEELQYYRPGRISRALFGPGGMGGSNIRYQLGQLGYTREQIDQMDPGMQRMIVARAQIPEEAPATPVAAPVAAVAQNNVAEPSVSREREQPLVRGESSRDIISMIGSGGAPPTPDRAAGLKALGEALPDTATPLMQKILEEQQAGMEGKRGSNLNLALMQAGLGMMGSKGRGLQGVAEGGLEGLKAYREGMSEIQKGEQLIQASKLEMAKAQDARSRGLFDLQLRDEANAAQLYNQGETRRLMGQQILATLRGQDLTLRAAELRASSRGDLTPSPSEMKAAEDLADKRIMELVTQGQIKPASPQAAATKQQLVQQYLAQSGKVYMPMQASPGSQQFDFNAVMGQ